MNHIKPVLVARLVGVGKTKPEYKKIPFGSGLLGFGFQYLL